MSGKTHRKADEGKVPLGVVFVTIGAMILLTICAVWVVAPYTMPAPLYAAVERQMGQSSLVPTRAAVAEIPSLTVTTPGLDETAVLLPESSIGENEYPEHFVSAETAVRRQPGDGEPGRILIPAIGLDAPVSAISLESVSSNGATYFQWPVPNEFRAGWHDNSARLGQPGNTVLNGHHNIYGQVFRHLVELNEGDTIIVHDGKNQSFRYEVTAKEIFPERDQPLAVRLENAHWIGATDDERLTLVTCWPLTDNSHRLVIVAHPVKAGQSSTAGN
jgi:LPXTG-site transpeptidase (sortase) family protein